MFVTSPSTTRVFSCRLRISRVAGAISPSERIPVATWYSSGWNRWWLVLPMIVTSTGARLSAWAAKRPPKPVPTITTRGRPVVDALPAYTGDVVMMNPVSHSGGSRPRRVGSDPGHILPAQRVREPILTRIQDNDGVGGGMPRVLLVPGLGLDARSSARLRALLPAVLSVGVVLLPGMGL